MASLSSYRSSIKSIQRGTIFHSSVGSVTATITSVDTLKANLCYLGNDSSANSVSQGSVRIKLTNATTVLATKMGGSSTATSYEVVEYY